MAGHVTLTPEDGALLDALRGLRWQATKPPRPRSMGAHLSRRLAPSAELTEYRPYRQGDETRRIDWKVLAKTNRAFIRLAQDYSQTQTLICLEASATMGWPVADLGKWHYARQIALGLAAATRAAGDPVGLVLSGGETAQSALPVEGNPGTVFRIANLLRDMIPNGQSDLSRVLQGNFPHRLVVIGDFLGEEAGLSHLAAVADRMTALGGECIALNVAHRRELDPEIGAQVLYDPRAPDTRRSLDRTGAQIYRDRFAAWRDDLAHMLRRKGAQYMLLRTDEAATLAVRRLVARGS